MIGRDDFGNITNVHKRFFVERKEAYSKLSATLSSGGSAILYGRPQIGKSAFAEKFILRFQKEFRRRTKTTFYIGNVSFLGTQFRRSSPTPLVEQFREMVSAMKQERSAYKAIIVDEFRRGINTNSIWSESDQFDFVNYLNDLLRDQWQLVLILEEAPSRLFEDMPKLRSSFPRLNSFTEIEVEPFTRDECSEYCKHSVAPTCGFLDELYERSAGCAGAINIMLRAANRLYGKSRAEVPFDAISENEQVRNCLLLLDWQRKRYDGSAPSTDTDSGSKKTRERGRSKFPDGTVARPYSIANDGKKIKVGKEEYDITSKSVWEILDTLLDAYRRRGKPEDKSNGWINCNGTALNQFRGTPFLIRFRKDWIEEGHAPRSKAICKARLRDTIHK